MHSRCGCAQLRLQSALLEKQKSELEEVEALQAELIRLSRVEEENRQLIDRNASLQKEILQLKGGWCPSDESLAT